jgi:carbonic anhydrase/acetyltransferase-like protein (isoleucine patch superfamily)
VVWESAALTTPEAHLPGTVSLEPEAHVWQVTALKGADVLIVSNAGRFTVTP